ncbi:sarcosine oxidase subunit gamma family protein [Chelativorans salis]|uniref:Sarcosine oxidase subunit gamma n=1 Tax=Chelativorans salis TaxID=2978478 RepID=A0ABT2LKW7_9HYPH|nr:sarcosine oxidase subunit gamma family protein [Chelativorans sp. EGI FJ00035]MCT7375235.1 sarcosine oxidase subunit gamma [Chelativorans sp. EGI FJ00035]
MVERISPLGEAFRPGTYGNLAEGPGVTLTEATPVTIAEAAAWPGSAVALSGAIETVTGLSLPAAPGAGVVGGGAVAFSIGPGRYLVAGAEGLSTKLQAAISLDMGTVTDLSHGRAALRIAGPRAEWVLSKLFALDFSPAAFPVGEGRATAHHDIFAQIQRTGGEQFDIYVFRSFARAFWQELCAAAEETGYEVR